MRTRKKIVAEYAERLTDTSYQKLSLEVLLDLRALLMEELGHEEEEEAKEEEEAEIEEETENF